MADPNKLETHPFRQSLFQKPLLFGVSRGFLVVELVAISVLALFLGTDPLSMLVAAGLTSVLHWQLARLSRSDPHLPMILFRHFLQSGHWDVGLHPRDDEQEGPRSVPKDIRK